MQVCQLLGTGLLGGGTYTPRADLAGGRGSWAGIPPRLEGASFRCPGLGSGCGQCRGLGPQGVEAPQPALLCFAAGTKITRRSPDVCPLRKLELRI